jgi:hypothetical protein
VTNPGEFFTSNDDRVKADFTNPITIGGDRDPEIKRLLYALSTAKHNAETARHTVAALKEMVEFATDFGEFPVSRHAVEGEKSIEHDIHTDPYAVAGTLERVIPHFDHLTGVYARKMEDIEGMLGEILEEIRDESQEETGETDVDTFLKKLLGDDLFERFKADHADLYPHDSETSAESEG